ncbi:MAG TPA: ABC transporter substrate-binding protein [Elusimicrobiota bacterium]|nr:ABC transporter substrate-binding protein [Elusimicrobiota bacterium]
MFKKIVPPLSLSKRNILSLALLPLLLGGTATGAEPVIKVGVSPTTSSSALYIALEQGYFKEQGLNVKLVTFPSSGAPMTIPLSQNQLSVGGGNLSAGLWNAIQQNLGLKLVADKGSVSKEHDYIGLLVRKDHVDSGRYKSLQDLKGFTLGLTALNGVSQEIVTELFLKKGGLTPNDIRLVKMSYAEMNVALRTKNLDATVNLEPYLTQAVLDGFAVRVAGSYDVYPDQQSAAIIYSPGFAQDRTGAAEKFMVAYLKGARDYEDAFTKGKNTARIISLLQKHLQISPEAVWEKLIPAGINPDGRLNLASLERDLAWYKDKGYLTDMPDLQKAVDHRFVEKALETLGPYK